MCRTPMQMLLHAVINCSRYMNDGINQGMWRRKATSSWQCNYLSRDKADLKVMCTKAQWWQHTLDIH